MKKALLICAAALLGGTLAQAQNYYMIPQTGLPQNYNLNGTQTGYVSVIAEPTSGSKDGVLSAAISMPFTWSFFGEQVSQFKVSENGYITFDASATVSNNNPVNFPDTSAPKKAIFAYWADLELQYDANYYGGVNYFVEGTAPNRTLTVNWANITPKGSSVSSAFCYFSVAIFEKGGFEIRRAYGDGSITGRIGAQNGDGTVGLMVPGSPLAVTSSVSTAANAIPVYLFKYGTQPAIDVHLLKNQSADVIGIAQLSSQDIKVSATDFGTAAVNTATINYSVNGAAAISAPLSTIGLTANGGNQVTLTHPTKLLPLLADVGSSKSVVIWLSNINGTGSTSDSIETQVFMNKGIAGSKKTLIEEGSGAWCGFCPDGHLTLKGLIASNSGKVIGVVHHNEDAMSNTSSDEINTTYATGFPYGMVDRIKFEDEGTVGIDRNLWTAKAALQLNTITPVNVSILNKTYNWSTRKLEYDVKVDFVDEAIPGDLRINTYIVESNIRGPEVASDNTDWTQHNYYSSEFSSPQGGSSHPLYNEPEYMIGYKHNEVVRAIPSGTWGSSGVITTAHAGQSYTQHYSYTLPATQNVTYTQAQMNDDFRSTYWGAGINKHEDTKIVAFVSYYNSDATKRNVLNAEEASLVNTGIAAASNDAAISKVFPNPSNGSTSVDFSTKHTGKVSIAVSNLVGQTIANLAEGMYAAGDHSLYFSTTAFAAGTYFITVSTAEGSATYKFIVSK